MNEILSSLAHPSHKLKHFLKLYKLISKNGYMHEPKILAFYLYNNILENVKQFFVSNAIVTECDKVKSTLCIFQMYSLYSTHIIRVFRPGRFYGVTGFLVFSQQIMIGYFRYVYMMPCMVRTLRRGQKQEKSQCEITKNPVTPSNRLSSSIYYIV